MRCLPMKGTHRLAQAHLVGQDAVEAVVPQADHPAHPLQLVVPQLSLDQRQEDLEIAVNQMISSVSVWSVNAPA